MIKKLLPGLVLLAACGVEDPDLSTTESDVSVTRWQPTVAIPNKVTTGQPSAVYYKNHLNMAFRSGGRVAWSVLDGTTWSTTTQLDILTTGDPRLTLFNGAMYLVAEQDNNATVWMSYDGARWTQTATIPGTHPSIAALGSKLYVGLCVGDRIALDEVVNGAGVERFSRQGATPAPNEDEVEACASTALVSFGGKLHLLWNDIAVIFDPALHISRDFLSLESTVSTIHELDTVPGSTSVVVDDIGMRSLGPLSMAVCNGTVHLVHNGDAHPDDLWWASRNADGSGTWSSDARIPNQSSSGGAGVACNVYVQPTMIHNTSSSDVLVSSIFQ